MTEKEIPALSEESPMNKVFNSFDLEHLDWNDRDYILNATTSVDIKEMNALLVEEINWKKTHGQNFVASAEGIQGSGKSMGLSYLGLLLASVFGIPFTVEKNVFFDPVELDNALGKARPCETFLRDEHLKAKAGLMSNLIDENLSDYEDQLRRTQNNLLFAAVQLQNHSHFFCFEAKHVKFDETGYPISFVSILKTPRYTDRTQFVWRGYVSFPMPNKEFVEAYLKKKDDHIEKLKRKYGNTLDPVAYFAGEILKNRELQLVRKTKDGFIIPIKDQLMEFVIAGEIGTRKFTNAGYDLLKAKLRQNIIDKFEEFNNNVAQQVEAAKIVHTQQRDVERQKEISLLEEKRESKFNFLKDKLAEEKRKNDIKEKALALKERALEELKELAKSKSLKGVETAAKKQVF